MPITEKITQEDDLYIYEILRNPVLFGEFVYNYDKTEFEEPFEFTWYQKESLCDFSNYVSLEEARATGKTVSLSSLIIWMLVFRLFPNDYIVYSVPSKVHLEPVFTNLIKQFRSNSFLKMFIAKGGGINGSDFTIKLLNTSNLICRIAGQTGTGVSVIGLHTPFFMVDESGYYPWGTWVELQPTINTFTDGFRLMVAGVPTGLREKNVNYHCDQENSNYSKHRISALQNPRWTEEDRQRAIEQHGGEDSDDYIHLVLAEHGKPIFSLFDRTSMEISQDPVYKLEMNGLQMQGNMSEYITKLSALPSIRDKRIQTILGIDLGYTEPTAILVIYLDDKNRMRFHAKIRLDKVAYDIQEKIIDLLDTKYNPLILGIDKGSAGISTLHHLQNDVDYTEKGYDKRIVPVDFSANISLGFDNDGQEIKSKTKPFAVSILQDYTNNHRIVYSSTDIEMITELERMTYSKNASGEISYKTLTVGGGKKGEDHFTSALLCGTLAYYLQNDYFQLRTEKKKLVSAQWIR